MRSVCRFCVIIIATLFYSGCSGDEATAELVFQHCNVLKNETVDLYEDKMLRELNGISAESEFHAFIEMYLPVIENLGERSKECASKVGMDDAGNFIEINLLLNEMWAHLTASKETTSLGERYLLMNVEFTQSLLQKGLEALEKM